MIYSCFQSHGQSVANLREALKQRPDKACAVMLDTKGPEIRTGLLKDHQPVEFVAGQTLQIVTDYAIEGDNTRIACSYRALPETVQIGSIIYIADGSLTCEVTEIQEVSYTAPSTRLSEINNYKIFLRDFLNWFASLTSLSAALHKIVFVSVPKI